MVHYYEKLHLAIRLLLQKLKYHEIDLDSFTFGMNAPTKVTWVDAVGETEVCET